MEDYFDVEEKFLREKNADLANNLYDEYKRAFASEQFCSMLLKDKKKIDVFNMKMRNLIIRINSVGFSLNQMKKEEKEWEEFMGDACNPERLPDFMKVDENTTAVEPITLAYTFESFLFFVRATLEYLSHAIGVIFSNPNERKIFNLMKTIKNNYKNNKLGKKVLKILEDGRPIWAEMEEIGVRKYFENVEPYIEEYNGKPLRDTIGHHRPVKISPIQMTIGKNYIVHSQTLKAGVWKAKIGEKANFGSPYGLIYNAEEYTNKLVNWIGNILQLIFGEKSIYF